MPLIFVLLYLANLAISWFNAYSVGRSWADSKAVGGWVRFMTWCGAVMSACGFTWCYLIVLAMIAGAAGWLPPQYVKEMLELGYIVIIGPILGSGIAICLDSITTAYRERSVNSIGIATWNTFAQVHNTYEAARTLPGVFGDLKENLDFGEDGGDSESKLVLLVMVLVLGALSAGPLTTAIVIRSTARKYAQKLALVPMPRLYEAASVAAASSGRSATEGGDAPV